MECKHKKTITRKRGKIIICLECNKIFKDGKWSKTKEWTNGKKKTV